MEQITSSPESHQPSPTKSLIYWRKSPINGFRCVPVLLTLEPDNTLTMKTAKNVIAFQAPMSQVQAHFTGWGTMVLVVNGKKYVFVGIGAAVSPSPTAEQKAELGGAYSALSSAGGRAGAVGLGVGAVASVAGQQAVGAASAVAGVAVQEVAYYRSLGTMREWQDIFAQAGVLTSKKSSMSYMKYYLIGLLVLVALILIIGTIGKHS
jgi:hypothetical protein